MANRRTDTGRAAARDFFSLEAVDFDQLQDEVSASPEEEDALLVEAVNLARQAKFSDARDVSESVLLANPTNATALQVNASECESRQDWGEAARVFLSGIQCNVVDGAMEHGFQTNVELMRANRPRWLERSKKNKWDDVLSFKPRPVRSRGDTPGEKPPWWRLGAKFEALVKDGGDDGLGYLNDLLEMEAEPEEEREEIRRVIWENNDFLDNLYAYYARDMNETWDASKPIEGMIKHTGDETEVEDRNSVMRMPGLWRIVKDCKMAMGDVKVKMHAAVFNRVHARGILRLELMKKADASFDLRDSDPHDRCVEISFYSFVETLIRSAHLKMQGSGTVSQRFEALMKDHIRSLAMKKQVKRDYLDFRNKDVQACLLEPVREQRLRKIYDYFISSYKSNKLRSDKIGDKDMTLTMNHVLVMMDKTNLFDPDYNVKKCTETYGSIICDTDLLPQEHPNNQNSEMTFWEFLEFAVRISKLKKSFGNFSKWIDEDFIAGCARVIPGKI